MFAIRDADEVYESAVDVQNGDEVGEIIKKKK